MENNGIRSKVQLVLPNLRVHIYNLTFRILGGTSPMANWPKIKVVLLVGGEATKLIS